MVRLDSAAFVPQRIGVWFESVCLVPECFLFLPPPRTSIKRAKSSLFTTNMCTYPISSGEAGLRCRKPMLCSLDAPTAPGSKNGACQSEQGYKDKSLQSRFTDRSRSILHFPGLSNVQYAHIICSRMSGSQYQRLKTRIPSALQSPSIHIFRNVRAI